MWKQILGIIVVPAWLGDGRYILGTNMSNKTFSYILPYTQLAVGLREVLSHVQLLPIGPRGVSRNGPNTWFNN